MFHQLQFIIYFLDKRVSKKRKIYSKYSDEMKQAIKEYYIDPSNSYTCPGTKEYVKIVDDSGKKLMVQKRLLLFTLRDLYSNFIHDQGDSEVIPSFSYFASLKPQECIHAGDPGSRTICVCEQHQNVKLKLCSISKRIQYRDMIEASVCSVDEADCMLHKCSRCPGINGLKEKLSEYEQTDNKQTISYKKWINRGSRASLETVTELTAAFKDNIIQDVWKLTEHHYIADAQKNYFKHAKENLAADECVLVIDFSENYSFIIQQSVQAFYYNNLQATVHPVVMYYRDQDKAQIQEKSFCIISDTTEHFAYTVHAFLKELTGTIRHEYPWIKKIKYFSDGAPNQYKNK